MHACGSGQRRAGAAHARGSEVPRMSVSQACGTFRGKILQHLGGVYMLINMQGSTGKWMDSSHSTALQQQALASTRSRELSLLRQRCQLAWSEA